MTWQALSGLDRSIDELQFTTEGAMQCVAQTVPVDAGATAPHHDLIRAPPLHLLAVLQVLPAVLVGGLHLAALVVALAAEWSTSGPRFR